MLIEYHKLAFSEDSSFLRHTSCSSCLAIIIDYKITVRKSCCASLLLWDWRALAMETNWADNSICLHCRNRCTFHMNLQCFDWYRGFSWGLVLAVAIDKNKL